MERRNFIAACAATTGAVACASARETAAAKKGPFADAPLKMSIQPKWFPGKTMQERLPQIAEWGFPAFEHLKLADVTVRPLMDKLGLVLSCRLGAGGQMVNPSDHDRILTQFKENVALAKKLNCPNVIALTGKERPDVSRFSFFDLDDVKALLVSDDVACLADLQLEDHRPEHGEEVGAL